jgi:hypothetical protein
MERKLSISFLLCLAAVFPLQGQGGSFSSTIGKAEKSYIASQLQETYWTDNPAETVREIPLRYKDAPAVVLQQTDRKEYYRNSRNYLRTVNFEHKVMLIQSRQGVLDNSVYSYEYIDNDLAFNVTAVRIIKPDGSVFPVDLDSIAVTTSYENIAYREFVIPGLEVGDILDYYYYIEFRVVFPQQYSRIFDPVYWLPQDRYPVMDYELEFVLGPSAFINASSHALPAFDQVDYKIDKKTFSRYSMALRDLDPVDLQQPYLYPFRELPNLRFQVFIGPYSGNTDLRYNLGGSLRLNTAVQPSRLQDFMAFAIGDGRNHKKYFSEFRQYLKFTGVRKGKADAQSLVEAFYYYERAGRELAMLRGQPVNLDDFHFVSRTSYILGKLGVDSDVVLAFDRSLTDIDQYILTDEIVPVLRSFTADTVLLVNPLQDEIPGEVRARLERGKAITIHPSTFMLGKMPMPASTASDNRFLATVDFYPSPDGSGSVRQDFRLSGHEKTPWQQMLINRAVYFTDTASVHTDLLAFRHRKGRSSEEIILEMEELAVQRDREVETAVYELLPVPGEALSDLNWAVEQPGNTVSHPDMTWWLEFAAREVCAVANGRILVGIGDALTANGTVSHIDSARQAAIYIDHPYERSYTLLFRSLSGYEFGEYDHLATKVDNAAGFFKSSAKVSDDGLTIRCTYRLDKAYLPAADAGALADILDAFAWFKSQKVLYRKKE